MNYNDKIILDKDGLYFFNVNCGDMHPRTIVFRAQKFDQVREWLKEKHEDFKDMIVTMTEQPTQALMYISWRSIKDEDKFIRICITAKLVNPPVVKTLADLSLEQKVEAILNALRIQGIKIEVK